MQFPPMLQQRMKGKPLTVAGSVSTLRGDLSIVGVKTVILSDHPGIYLHDTGGICGQERVLALDQLDSSRVGLVFADQSRVLRGKVEFPDGPTVLVEFRQWLEKVADTLLDLRLRTQPDLLFETPFPVRIKCKCSEGKEGPEQQAPGDDETDLGDADVPAPRAALYAHIVVRGNRLRLLDGGQPLADIPLDRVQSTQPGERKVVLKGEVMVAGSPTRALAISLPSAAMAARLSQVVNGVRASPVGPAPPPACGLVESVQVKGRLAEGQPINRRLDAILTDEALVLREMDSGLTLCRFPFSDPAVSVAGTASRFILASDTAGPVAVSGGADRFRERLVRNEAVVTAARRTLAHGPYLAFLGDDPVVCRTGKEALEILSAGGTEHLAYSEFGGNRRDVQDGQEALTLRHGGEGAAGRDVRLTGEREALQGLFEAVAGERAVRQFAGRPRALIGTILGLERDYFLYTLFGPLYEVHAILGTPCGQPSLHQPVPLPDTTEKGLALANVMAQGLEPLRNHLEKVCYYLPSLLVKCDAGIYRSEGPPPRWLKEHERAYRLVLTGVQPVLAEIRMIREYLLRIRGVRERLGRETDYSGAVLTAALGAMINPLMLVSAAQQAFAVSRHSERQKEEQGDSAGELIERAVRQWNYLLLELLPSLWHHLLDGLFPMRFQLYQRIGQQLEAATQEQKGGLLALLTRRLAVLTTFLHYPAGETAKLTRGMIASGARRIQDQLSYNGFQLF
jgi:hypothetical protein